MTLGGSTACRAFPALTCWLIRWHNFRTGSIKLELPVLTIRMPWSWPRSTTQGQPRQRTVLLKYYDNDGFVFFTNLESTKAKHIAANSKVSLLFPWLSFERQVIIDGLAERISAADSVRYFMSRPHDSQLAAWVSNQSQPLSSRQALLQKFDEIKRKFAAGQVPMPSFWGGYRVRHHRLEFWQGREQRLHDRFEYTPSGDGNWQIERLAP